RIQQVPFVKLNAGDTAHAWSAALPAALAWIWQQLAPPDLRDLFPVPGQGSNLTTLPVRPVKGHHLGACKIAVDLPCVHLAPGQAKQPGSQTG
ncbi:MAG: hypothetical protein QOG28_4013, partial [Trebonia sp.]|nr:hypothetical protein [Trebonia sp.]